MGSRHINGIILKMMWYVPFKVYMSTSINSVVICVCKKAFCKILVIGKDMEHQGDFWSSNLLQKCRNEIHT